MEEFLTVIGVFVVILGIIALVFGVVIFWGWLTMLAWNLIIAGLFHGPTLNLLGGIAVNFLLGLVSHRTIVQK